MHKSWLVKQGESLFLTLCMLGNYSCFVVILELYHSVKWFGSRSGLTFYLECQSFFLSIFTGSLIYEHYTRECEFGNFDKIKNTKHKKKQNNTKKHKNFWLNFCLNKECPKLLCGLGICHRRRQTIPMWNSTGEKRILQGITVCLVSAVLSTM